jgi:hypothetical protein
MDFLAIPSFLSKVIMKKPVKDDSMNVNAALETIEKILGNKDRRGNRISLIKRWMKSKKAGICVSSESIKL